MFWKKPGINQISAKFCAIIEDLSFMTDFGISDRLLPYPKEVIGNALLSQALLYRNKGDRNKLDMAIMAYLHLSLFIPYEKYKIVKIAYGPQGVGALLKADGRTKDNFLAIQNEILGDMKKRMETVVKLRFMFAPEVEDLESARKKILADFTVRL